MLSKSTIGILKSIANKEFMLYTSNKVIVTKVIDPRYIL